MPDRFAHIELSRLVRAEIRKANKAIVRALVIAADAGDKLAPEVVGVPTETLDLLSSAKSSRLDALTSVGFRLWDFRYPIVEEVRPLLRGERGAQPVVLSPLVHAGIQEANKALMTALIKAADSEWQLAPDIVGVPQSTLHLLSSARASQLDALNGTGFRLWEYRFGSPELSQALLSGDTGTTAATHHILSGLKLTPPPYTAGRSGRSAFRHS